MKIKFEWLLNVAFALLLTVVGSLVTFVYQFLWVQIAVGIVFYGGLGYLAIFNWRERRQRKPRQRLDEIDVWRFVAIGVVILGCTLVVLLIGTALLY